MKVSLIIFLVAIVLYFTEIIVFSIKIHKAKKDLMDSSVVKKPNGSFWGVFICSFFLILLPALIPFAPYVIATISGCGVMGAFIGFKERLELIRKISMEEKSASEFSSKEE